MQKDKKAAKAKKGKARFPDVRLSTWTRQHPILDERLAKGSGNRMLTFSLTLSRRDDSESAQLQCKCSPDLTFLCLNNQHGCLSAKIRLRTTFQAKDDIMPEHRIQRDNATVGIGGTDGCDANFV